MKKIMFNDRYGLTGAVLNGTKTMTRRICTLTLHRKLENGTMEAIEPDDMFVASDGTALFQIGRNGYRVPKENQPAYHVGEEIAIAQPYKVTAQQNRKWLDLQLEANGQYIGELMDSGGWENKMLVSAYYCPNHIHIKSIKVERLQDISDEDCLREGVELEDWRNEYKWGFYTSFFINARTGGQGSRSVWYNSPQKAFGGLIDRISGRGTWQRNPYVFAYSFELIR